MVVFDVTLELFTMTIFQKFIGMLGLSEMIWNQKI